MLTSVAERTDVTSMLAACLRYAMDGESLLISRSTSISWIRRLRFFTFCRSSVWVLIRDRSSRVAIAGGVEPKTNALLLLCIPKLGHFGNPVLINVIIARSASFAFL